MFTDIVGYSALASQDERAALELLEEQRQIFRRIFPNFGGRENKTIGDAFFIEFGSAVDAVQCAIEVQTALYERNSLAAAGRKIWVRIGLHLGDVMEHEGDTFGDGVNIAARVEALALAGGVCLTRQVYDQVSGKLDLRVRRVGRVRLKNIATPTDLFRVRFPWEQTPTGRDILQVILGREQGTGALRRTARLRSWSLAGLSAAVLSVAAFTTYATLTSSGHPLRFPAAKRATSPAPSDAAPDRVPLRDHWTWISFASTDAHGNEWSVEQIADLPETRWSKLDSRRPWLNVDPLSGEFWLRREFTLKPGERFHTPAIVLGPVSGRHRVYLNGHFIGGSELGTSVEYFPFDPSELSDSGENVLLIHAVSPPSLTPGISFLPSVGSFLGEFEDVFAAASLDRFGFHVLRTVQMVFSVVMSFACLAYFLGHRERRRYLYFGLYLMLGGIALAYHNIFVAAVLDFRFYRFIKISSLTLSSFMLLSAHLAERRRRRLELLNNLTALGVVSVGAALTLFGTGVTATPSEFMARYNGLVGFAGFYTAAWTTAVSSRLLARIYREWKARRISGAGKIHFRRRELTICFFGIITGLTLFSALKSDALAFALNSDRKFVVERLSTWVPFLFAITVLGAGVLDYIRKSRRAAYKTARDGLILEIVRAVGDSRDLEDAIGRIQQKVCAFVGAERSSLYLSGREKNEGWLAARYVVGMATAQRLVAAEVSETEGIIGYACQHRAPLLIADVRTDIRVAARKSPAEPTSSDPEPNAYQSGACMVFPLTVRDELFGVLTLADKRGGGGFSQDDFALLHVVSKNIALMLQNIRLQERIRRLERAS